MKSVNNGTDSSNANDGDHGKHQQLYHLVYVVGFCVVFTAVDFVFLWPETHLFALLVLASGVSLIATYEMAIRGVRPQRIVFVVLCLFGIAILTYKIVGPIHIPSVEVSGTLQPGNEPTPPTRCDTPPPGIQPLPPETLKILIGDNTLATRGFGRFRTLQIGACEVLTLERSAETLSVDADLYDDAGRLLARLRNGKFSAMSGEHSSIDRANDLSTLIIKDGSGRELLYLHYLNQGTMRIRGVFGCPGHSVVPVKDEEPIPGFFMRHGCIVGGPNTVQIQIN